MEAYLPDFIRAYPLVIEPFKPFALPHIVAITLSLLFLFLTIYILRRERFRHWRKPYRYTLLALMIVLEIIQRSWHILLKQDELASHMGFQLCGIAIILAIITLITGKETFLEVIYFWGLAAAPQVLLSPALGPYGFPHYHFIHQFISHTLLINFVLYFTLVEGYRPGPRSPLRVLIITNLYGLILIPVNHFLGTNYLFLCRKPPNTIMEIMGPWPWYILVLEALAFILFSLVYLPVWLERKKKGTG